jgi:hypothetical protein
VSADRSERSARCDANSSLRAYVGLKTWTPAETSIATCPDGSPMNAATVSRRAGVIFISLRSGIGRLELKQFDNLLVRHELQEAAVVGIRCARSSCWYESARRT